MVKKLFRHTWSAPGEEYKVVECPSWDLEIEWKASRVLHLEF
jgi:hypothetical protein